MGHNNEHKMKQIILFIFLSIILSSCIENQNAIELVNEKISEKKYAEALEIIDQNGNSENDSNLKLFLIKKQLCENKLGKYSEAIKTVEKLVETGNVDYLNQIAILHYKNGNIDKALSTMKRLKMTKQNYGFPELLNLGLFEFGNSNYQQSLKYFNSAIEIDKDVYIYYYIALCEIELGNYNEAIFNLDEYEKSEGNNLNLFVKRAYAKLKLGNKTEALIDLEKVSNISNEYDKEDISFFELENLEN